MSANTLHIASLLILLVLTIGVVLWLRRYAAKTNISHSDNKKEDP